jgi:integrase
METKLETTMTREGAKLPYSVVWRAVRAAYHSSKARVREVLAERGVELIDCWKRGETVCLVVRENGEAKRLHFNIQDYPRRCMPFKKQPKPAAAYTGGNKLVWKELTITQKARYIEMEKHTPSYPWQPTGLKMRGGSRIRHARGFMKPGSRWWEVYFKMDRDSWLCPEHPTVQRVLDYLVRKAGGVQYASLQSRRNILIALALFCRHYQISPEEACQLSPAELSGLVQGFCDRWMHAGKVATAQRHLMSLSTFFDKNGFPRRTDRALTLQHYGYRVGVARVPTWNGPTVEYKPTKAEVWRMAHSCGSTLEGLRDKAIILFGIGTGTRNADVRAFQYGRVYHFKGLEFSFKRQLAEWDGKSPIVVPITLELKDQVPNACKWRRQHYKLLFPEAVQALKDYLTERERLYGPIGDSEPLFASHANNLPEHVWRRHPMSPSTLSRIVKLAARRAFQGDGKEPERWRGVHPHVFKDCFLEVLDRGDALTGVQILSQNDKAFLMGHRLPGSMENYYNPKKLEELKEKWLRLGWTERVPGATPLELRKRQLLDWMRFLGVPADLQDKVKAIVADWGKPEDFESGLPIIRAIIEGRVVKARDVEATLPGYRLQLREGEAYLGSARWLRSHMEKPKQRIVNVEEAERLLLEGWRFKAALPNGKCVVEHPPENL